MKMKTLLSPLASAICLSLTAASSPAQQFVTIATESFDYAAGPLGDLNGGTGWAVDWWAGATLDDVVVSSPGFDAVGLKATTTIEHMGCYRTLDAAGFDAITDNLRFGKDNTTIWINFQCQRDPFSDDWYGGISLFEQWVGEKLFIGSPHGADRWGVDLPFAGSPSWAFGTDCSFLATLWARIDFLPGDERVRLWVDPAAPYPDTVPDVDAFYPDFRFNEIRLQSGSGFFTGFHFDDLVISTPAFAPILEIANLVEGQTAVMTLSNFSPSGDAYVAFSFAGGGPTTTPYGDLQLSQPWTVLPRKQLDVNGQATVPFNVPTGTMGRNVWIQAYDFTSGQLSNGLAEVIG